ncbi:MAG: nitroreductase family protein [Ilumatobacteraceae bacterium]
MTRNFVSVPAVDSLGIDQVMEWCELARRAPSAGHSQGLHFLVRSDVARTLEDLGSLAWWTRRQPGVLNASTVVVVLVDPSSYTDRYGQPDKEGPGLERIENWRIPYWLTDAGMAIQNLLLIIEAERHGALFAGVFRDPRSALSGWGVPENLECVGLIFVGVRHPGDRPTGSSVSRPWRPRDEVVHRETWTRQG